MSKNFESNESDFDLKKNRKSPPNYLELLTGITALDNIRPLGFSAKTNATKT